MIVNSATRGRPSPSLAGVESASISMLLAPATPLGLVQSVQSTRPMKSVSRSHPEPRIVGNGAKGVILPQLRLSGIGPINDLPLQILRQSWRPVPALPHEGVRQRDNCSMMTIASRPPRLSHKDFRE